MAEKQYVIGIDFGTDSVRSIVVDSGTGKTLASEVVRFKRWGEGLYCDPAKNQFRQHPLDYIEGLEKSVKRALAAAGKGSGKRVVGIGVDTTTTLVISQVVLSFGIPFALVPMILLTRRADVMGAFANSRLTNAAAAVVAAIVICLNVFLLIDTLVLS